MRKNERKLAIGDQVTWLTGLGLGLTVTMQITTLSSFDFTDPYAVLTTISRLFALVGSYLSIIGLFLIARIPWVERAIGHDRLIVWHRKAMPYSLLFIALHVILVLVGSAGANQRIIALELWNYIAAYEWMLAATVGFVLLVMAGITSYKRVRAQIKYETWWVIHLYTYIGVALSFMHQVLHGSMFVGHPLNRAYWTSLYVAVAGAILLWRVGIPLYRSIKHEIRVERIEVEAPNVFSIYMKGRNLLSLKAQGGQFFNWRFMTGATWIENHPFSLSAAPTSNSMRITIKVLGDGTSHLARLPIGTRVIMEGPYGTFTKDVIAQDQHAVLIAGGVGVTPIRALIDELPLSTTIDVIYRVKNAEDAPLLGELEQLEKDGRINFQFVPGPRDFRPINPESLLRMAPNITLADVYVCGPETLVHSVRAACKELDLPNNRIHHEFFEYHAN